MSNCSTPVRAVSEYFVEAQPMMNTNRLTSARWVRMRMCSEIGFAQAVGRLGNADVAGMAGGASRVPSGPPPKVEGIRPPSGRWRMPAPLAGSAVADDSTRLQCPINGRQRRADWLANHGVCCGVLVGRIA